MLPLVAVISLFLATCFSQQTGRQADRQTDSQTDESTTCYASLYRVRYELTNGRKQQDDVSSRREDGKREGVIERGKDLLLALPGQSNKVKG